MKDVMDHLAAVSRETGTAKTPVGEGRTIVLRRTYQASVDEVWDALTTAERINRWFLPISGDLRLGGHYQFEGNAGGEVLACEPPQMLRISWVMGEPSPDNFSEVEVRLSPVDGGTQFELVHTATVPPEMWDQFGPGAVGVGWDGGLLGLGQHLANPNWEMSDQAKQEWVFSEEAKQFNAAASQAWGEAWRASGASDDQVAAGIAATTAFYVPQEQ
jgi:uncharacterized protein YndB with AHSA1/START domain